MWKSTLIFFLVILQFLALPVYAKQNQVSAWRSRTTPDYTRVVFEVSGKPDHKVMVLQNPNRLVIDFSNAQLAKPLQSPKKHNLFSAIRTSGKHAKNLRVVLELKNVVKAKSFVLTPNKSFGHRLVVDLIENKRAKKAQRSLSAKAVVNDFPGFVVAIDAGHGGEDPGAHGPRGTQEKTVVFAIAKKLKALVDKHPNMQGVMVRKGDYYVDLRNRMEIARQAKADLFISIHADAFKNQKVRGASVFTLSRNGASSEAAHWLADQENASDLVGGVSLGDKDGVLASVLLDLSQAATQDASRELAKQVLRNFKRIGKLHKKSVQKAGFLVLKAPDIPSILVETAYISNPTEEQKLRSKKHQTKMAKAIYKGVLAYYQRHLPEGVRMASTQHVITRGDTLSGIAVQYGVSMKKLQAANRLPNKQIRIGQVLSIPRS